MKGLRAKWNGRKLRNTRHPQLHAQRGPINRKPPPARRQGLGVRAVFQALAGAVLPDNDHYDASLLNRHASHAAHATTRVSNAQRIAGSAPTWARSRISLRLSAR